MPYLVLGKRFLKKRKKIILDKIRALKFKKRIILRDVSRPRQSEARFLKKAKEFGGGAEQSRRCYCWKNKDKKSED